MYHSLPPNARFWPFLTAVDEDLAETARKEGCPCGGRLHCANYPRKPRASDRRTRTSYLPDRAAEQKEIVERHTRGLHYVGDWHTHPDSVPEPSPRDLASMTECVTMSAHALNAFLLVIVGQTDAPAGLHVSVHEDTAIHRLTPNAIADDQP